MNLCIDVGNTTIGVGFFKEEKLLKRLTFTVELKKTSDEYESVIRRTLKENDLDAKEISGIILSSVVPSISDQMLIALKDVFNVSPLLIAPGIKTGLSIHVDNPNEIGNDLIADMVGAKEKYGYPCLIVDLGTASKILLIDKTGTFTSCVIMPGLALSLNSLTNNTALLPEVPLKTPKSIMARNTVEAMNAGVIFGHYDMIAGAVKRYEKELGYECKHIITGGSAVHLKELLTDDFHYEKNLCLEGLNSILRRNEVK